MINDPHLSLSSPQSSVKVVTEPLTMHFHFAILPSSTDWVNKIMKLTVNGNGIFSVHIRQSSNCSNTYNHFENQYSALRFSQ